jgi:iron complex outermembrane receptor protein
MKRSVITPRASILAFVTAVTLLPVTAHAQAAPEDLPQEAASEPGGEVVVTGSRIRRDPLDNPSPVTVVD